MHRADLKHDNADLQTKLEYLYTLRGGDATISKGLRQPYLDLLTAFGNPHLDLPPTIHVAGTNGKGSSIAMIRAIYEAAGYKVHAYTSPHLLRFNERIVLAGQDIDDDMLEGLIDEALEHNQDAAITFFEITTAIAFAAFTRVKADVVLLETGLGGRLDCTNVIQHPIATLITSVSMDHQEFLGQTIEAIASEKAGIMKHGAPCIIGHQTRSAALNALQNHADALNVRHYCAGEVFDYDPNVNAKSEHFLFKIRNSDDIDRSINISGLHQIRNASSVLFLVHCLQNQLPVNQTQIDAGLCRVNWPARLQCVQGGDTEIWYDGGHNEDAGHALAQWVIDQNHSDARPLHLIVGMKHDKDAAAFLSPLAAQADSLQIIPLNGVGRCLTAPDIESSLPITINANSISDSLTHITDSYKNQTKKRILICGSLYLAREISDTLSV